MENMIRVADILFVNSVNTPKDITKTHQIIIEYSGNHPKWG